MRSPLLSLAPLLFLTAAVARAAPPEVEPVPGRVVLGQDTAVVVRVRVPPGAGPVRAAASSGGFDVERLEGGAERVFRWTPPAVRYPLWALLSFWVEDGRAPEVATVRLPLLGRTTLDVSTGSGAEVVVVVGDARFGPVKANAAGRAQVPVEVPPDVTEARVLATRGALTTDRRAPLSVPVHRPLVAALTPDPLAPEGGWLVVEGEDGAAPMSALSVTAEGAQVRAAPDGSREPPTVRPLPGASRVALTVRWRDAALRDAARIHADVLSVVAPPAVAVKPPEDVRPPPAPEPPVALAPAPPLRERRLSLFVLGGGAFAGGANSGPLAGVGASAPLPVWNERLAAEAEVGARHASLEAHPDDMTVRSSVWGFPVLLSVRATLFQRGSFQLDGRAGGGAVFFHHHLSTGTEGAGDGFPGALDERKVGPMGFLAAQGAYGVGRWSVLAEVRAAVAPVETPSLRAELGGLSLSAGVRFTP